MFLCEINGKLIWRSNPDGHKVRGWSKHYFLDLPPIGGTGRMECSGGSMTNCTVKGAKLMEIV